MFKTLVENTYTISSKINMKIENKILEWNRLTNLITEDWIAEYFELDEEEAASGIDYDWVADDVGGIFQFADMFFNFSDILDCYKHKITREQLFTWYDYCLENQFINISLAQFILSPDEKAKKEQENLDKLKLNCIFAEEEFKKALEEYGK